MVQKTYDLSLHGLESEYIFAGHEGAITDIKWSMDGKLIASASIDKTIRVWDLGNRKQQSVFINKGRSGIVTSLAWSKNSKELAFGTTTKNLRVLNRRTNKAVSKQGHSASINSVSFSPDGKIRASGSNDRTIRVYNATNNGKLRFTLKAHSGSVDSLAWSPDSKVLATGSSDKTIRLWSLKKGNCVRVFQGHSGRIASLAFSPNGQFLVSASADRTIGVWDCEQKRLKHILEGHAEEVTRVSFSFDGRLLASQSSDGIVKVWRCDTWEIVREFNESSSYLQARGLAFHPRLPILATLDREGSAVHLWHLDIDAILMAPDVVETVRYSNAKVVLLGNTGVGKSGLAQVLTGKPFEKTDSTHGRRVWIFDSQESKSDDGNTTLREVLLWDLAGQPGYRLIHQLHLNEVAVAIVVFDSGSDTDPFTGVHYWSRALNEAQRLQGDAALPLKRLLVSARVDRGGIDASNQRIEAILRDLNFDGYFKTSAREGWEIQELSAAIQESIDWSIIPSISSTELFQRIKRFLVKEKQANRLLSSVEDLFRAFLQAEKSAVNESKNLRAQFETCIGRVESQGLVRKLSFGNLILLQPELLDAYASTLVMTARDESDGLGCIAEKKVREGTFRMSEDERISDREQEKLLLLATVEDLLTHEIALREESEDGTYLVFPSQFTRELPDVLDPEGKAVTFEFEGSVQNVYSRLAVRLSHSGLFRNQQMWKNAAIFTTYTESECGLLLRQLEDGKAELTLFFNKLTSEEIRFQFEEYISIYLNRYVVTDSLKRKRLFVCPKCSTPVTEQQATKRKEYGFNSIRCNVCDTEVSLLDRKERLGFLKFINKKSDIESDDENMTLSKIAAMDTAADNQRTLDTASSILEGKIATEDFDVFLCYDPRDKSAVRTVGKHLKRAGVLPWFDEWNLQPGLSWQQSLESHIDKIKSVAVFVGNNNYVPWDNQELQSFIREFVRKGCSVIPVLLSNVLECPKLPIFLKDRPWIDFGASDPDPMDQLLWGITGKRGLLKQNIDSDEEDNVSLKERLDISEKNTSELLGIVKSQTMRPMNSQTNHFHGPVGNVAGENYGSMTAHISQNSDDINRLMTTLRSAAQSFPEEQKEEVLMELDDIESDLKMPEKQNPKRIGRRLQRLIVAGTTAATLASGAATFSSDVNEFTENVVDLAGKIGISEFIDVQTNL
ncbi:TIR domain-containing protein [Adonisia turfae]|uniref:TIR domain-containing protein n=1 Tax=Adonisia turfae CCMR0081 TaxID=2292702 RepID=A0A6M0RQF4_9CYAN|nr:TIR domain-containing protein [Adonisia turfae]NEZ58498.1 TIR domain-containing protein [Adonisia turfae CCMR0081]